MTITFQALEIGEAGGRQTFSARAIGSAFPGGSVPAAFATGQSFFSLTNAGVNDDDFGEVVPTVPDSGTSTIVLRTSGYTASHNAEAGWSSFGVEHGGFALSASEAAGRSTFGLSTTGSEPSEAFANSVFFRENLPLFGGFAGIYIEGVDNTMSADSGLISLPLYSAVEHFRVSGIPDDTFTGLARAHDRIELGDLLAVVLRELLSEGFEIGGDASYNFHAVAIVADALRISGLVGSDLGAMNTVVAAIAFGDMLRRAEIEGLTDSMLSGDAVADSVRIASQLIEQILASAEGGPAAVFGAVVGDGFNAGDSTTAAMTAVEALRDGVSFTLHLNIDDGRYIAYVINTESKGLTEYSGYPFNSFAKMGGRYYGMTPEGIRELEGADDAGSPIAARLRLAMTSLGTGNMKRMIAAYLGYTSTGELRLKTITVGVDGQRQANHYRLHAQNADNPREARIKIGQGLRSVYWGFEIESIDGAAFMLDVLDLHPIVVEQRIQGEGGGKR